MTATNFGYATLQIIPSLKGAKSEVEKQLGNVDGTPTGKKVGSGITSGIGSMLKSAATGTVAAASAALGTALVKGFNRLQAIDNARQKLTGLGHDTKSVDAIMQNALASVKGTAFGLGDAATVAASAVAAGIAPGQELERTLKLVADASTIAGTDMSSMGAIFNKVAASNRLTLGVVNQMQTAGIPVLQMVAKEMGITAEEASKMVSSGKVDFETFQRAMETGLGGAALSSGDTFSGAMANIGASLGRVGANLMGGFFPKLAPLFQTITTALGPVEDKAKALGEAIGNFVVPMIDKLTKFLEGGLDKIKIAPQILGPGTAAFVALGASGLAPLLKMVPGLGGFGGALAKLGGPMGIVLAATIGLVASSPELRDALGGLLGALGDIGGQLGPQLEQLAAVAIPLLVAGLSIAADALTAIVNVAAGFLTWISESEGRVQALGIAVGIAAGAFIAWKVAQGGIALAGMTAQLAVNTAAWVKNTAAMLASKAQTIAIIGLYAKDFIVAFAKSTAAVVASTARWVANTAAMIASKVAMVASKAAMAVATAAQWLWNAALTANPIGLIITAVAALVGALIWFFTQTELGQEIWSNFTTFLSEAWANIVSFFTETGENLANWWNDLWSGFGTFVSEAWGNITSFFEGVWDGIVAIFEGALQWVVDMFMNWTIYGLIIKNWDSIAAFFVDTWNNITSFLQGAWENITSTITEWGDGIATWWTGLWTGIGEFVDTAWTRTGDFIRSVGDGIASWWNGLWTGVSTTVRGVWQSIVTLATSTFTNIKNAIWTPIAWVRDQVVAAFNFVSNGVRNAVNGIAGFVRTAFNNIIGAVRTPINAIVGIVNGAIGGLNRISISIPSWVPIVGGSTFGVNLPYLPYLAKGATVLPRPGGTPAILAEAGRAEAVVDEGHLNQLIQETRALLAAQGGDGGPRIVIEQTNINPTAEPAATQTDKALQTAATVGVL